VSRILNPRVILAVVVVLGAMIGSRLFLSIPLPGIQLPAEPIHLGPITLPNTLIATFLADITLLILVFAATRNMQLVPSGLQNVMELAIEQVYNLTEQLSGANAKKFFPWAMTIFLLVLVSNWWELIPGFDSIGWIESHTIPTAGLESSPGGSEVENEEVLPHYRVQTLFPGLATIVNDGYTPTAAEYEEAHDEHILPTNPAGEEVGVLVPFFRAAATDLNFTLAIALISMTMIQVYGIQALGLGYFTKFINLKEGAVGFIVGLIEIVSEVAKIVSFGFRLFGNIFAGQVLLFVMAFLVPWLLPVPFYGLELFVGFIQALVFAMLTVLFMQGATESHHGGDHADHGADHH
jgi:F-type H+-transporting ATPase subunit a